MLDLIWSEVEALKSKFNDYFGNSDSIKAELKKKLNLAADPKVDIISGVVLLGDVSETADPVGTKTPTKHATMKVGEGSSIQIFGEPKTDRDAVNFKVVQSLLEPIHESLTNALRYAGGPVFAHFFEMFDGKTRFDVSTNSKIAGHPEAANHFRVTGSSVSILKPGSYEVEVHISSTTMAPSSGSLTLLRFIRGASTTILDRLPSASTDVRLKGIATLTDDSTASVEWLVGGVAAGVSVSLTVTRLGD